MIGLRPLTNLDLEFLLEVRNDLTTRNNLENDSIFTLEQCSEWYLSTKPKWYIITNEHFESVGYLRTNGDEVGCDIHPSYRKNGYARAAYNEYLKDKTQACLWVFEDNFAKKLYESLGFLETGKSKKIRNRNYIHMIWRKTI